MEYYSTVKRNETQKHATAFVDLKKHHAQRKKSDTKDRILYDSIHMNDLE